MRLSPADENTEPDGTETPINAGPSEPVGVIVQPEPSTAGGPGTTTTDPEDTEPAKAPPKPRPKGNPVVAGANKAFEPAKEFFTEIGEMMILTGRTMASALKAPYPYGNEFIGQFLFALQLCWFPLLVSTVAFGFGAPGLQAANFLSLFFSLSSSIRLLSSSPLRRFSASSALRLRASSIPFA